MYYITLKSVCISSGMMCVCTEQLTSSVAAGRAAVSVIEHWTLSPLLTLAVCI